MKKTLLIYLLLILPVLFLFSCSEESSQLEALESAKIHQPGVLDSTSANFHGKFFVQKNMKFTDCQKCHGKNLDGGITNAKACSECHPLAMIHINLTGVQDSTSSNFHGRYLLQHYLADCGQCHGKDFSGGSSSPSCAKCHDAISVHKTNLLDSTSTDFHGKFIIKNKFAECQSCHGQNFTGGISSPSCASCHQSIDVHKEGIDTTTSDNFHGKYKLKSGLTDCSQCHGTSFSGGIQSPTCITCHSSIAIHKTGYKDTSSPDFHGKNQLAKDFTACKTCHGDNFQGGVNSTSCANCHKSIDVHKTGIKDPNSADFHGKYKLKNGLADCSSCHGISFSGGSQSPSCTTCHSTIDVHQSGINDQNSPNFHGKRNELKTSFAECQSCHGDNFQGGVNSPTCASSNCHSTIIVHKAGIKDINSADFHGTFLKANGWNISACASCHSSSFSGGTVSPTCKSSGCHISAQGPAACNTCHGDFNDPLKIAPPRDLNGHITSNYSGVGAHSKHLSAYANGISLACSECHTVPSDVNASGHLGNDGKAELNFGAFSNKFGGSSYDFTTNKCANTYCHGNFEFKKSDAGSSTAQLQYTADKMVGNNRSPVWTNSDGSETKCSSCHGIDDTHPSPIGHIPYQIGECYYCHSTVVDASGTIIDNIKHINGKINVFGTKFRK